MSVNQEEERDRVILTTRIQQTEAIAAWLESLQGRMLGWPVALDLAKLLREEPLK